ncbi:GNAT family N-acetyltransferase [Acidisoma silvae]|uniref:GNAT family N-acetyltransferase n=1 Tax=Acidisoma silvae TaxID=2802396 RepID=A0A963YVZ4_9PROT|nr:GNAT family N-acetyltransferase [Acidisoma silvae]MCB8877854.1 GNAT family N-acetyltransferase [Acidisoma silvae]
MIVEPCETLSTNRLVLRWVSLDDASSTSKLMTPAVSRCLASWPIPFTVDMAKTLISKLRDLALRGDALPFAITARQDGELLGWASIVRNPQKSAFASLSFWLGEAHHGKGYMREIASIIVTVGFKRLCVDIIEAGAQTANVGSFAVMKACGMTPAGERMVYASARARKELCYFYEVRRPLPPNEWSSQKCP